LTESSGQEKRKTFFPFILEWQIVQEASHMTSRRSGSELRHGFTTGSAVAAGAKVSTFVLAGQAPVPEVDIPLPAGGRLTIPVESVEKTAQGVKTTVIKDAGDDPDVTHRARISVTAALLPRESDPEAIELLAGAGVGRITKPGLPVPVGEPAINPVPREQIRSAVQEARQAAGLRSGVSLTVEVADGERIAAKTLNPRLGILGGISILGTRGTVKPFSCASYEATITSAMDVARAQDIETAALSTGGRSERLLKNHHPDLPEEAFIQVADFFAFSLKQAGLRGFSQVLLGCFFGKLVKMAQGHAYTHARSAELDFPRLARWALEQGLDQGRVKEIEGCNTARQALGIIETHPGSGAVLSQVTERAMAAARSHAGPDMAITFRVFDFDGRLLHTQRHQMRLRESGTRRTNS
jgi:cobalt-precorrin-5B (C1)-methyltransferase